MNLDINYLCSLLKDNTQEILTKIHNDPLLSKKYCPELDAWIANASKQLFTPKETHQLFAKGIIYKLSEQGVFRLEGMPYIKMYNHQENDFVTKHWNECHKLVDKQKGPIFLEKLDGTLISRNVILDKNGQPKVVFSTRGVLETQAASATESGEEENRFFKWTRKLVKERYPILKWNFNFQHKTMLFELVGPENRIVTFYPEPRLVLTGVYDKALHRYLAYSELLNLTYDETKLYKVMFELDVVKELEIPKTLSSTQKIIWMNNYLKDTDKEGTVIQFESEGQVIGRIKAKTDTYRSILRVVNNCDYKSISKMMEENSLESWDELESHLETLLVPEELKDICKSTCEQYLQHKQNCNRICTYVIGDCVKILKELGVNDPYDISKEQRKNFAKEATQNKELSSAYFAYLGEKLSTRFIMDKICETPKDSLELVNSLQDFYVTYN